MNMKKMTTIALFSALFLSLTSCKDGLGNYYTDYPIAGKDYVCQMTNGTRQKLAFGFSGTGIAYSVWLISLDNLHRNIHQFDLERDTCLLSL